MSVFMFIFLALLVLVTIGMLVVFHYVRKGIRFFRRFSTGDMSDDEFQRMANKYYREPKANGQQFGQDYFKGSGWDRGQAQQPSDSQRRHRPSHASSGGVTIEDRRDPGKAKKKIFARDEGEYVDFTEI